MEGPAAQVRPSHLSTPKSLTRAAPSCFVTAAPRRARQALPGLLAQALQNKVCNQKNGLQKKRPSDTYFCSPPAPLSQLQRTVPGPCGRTENSHSEGALPGAACARCDWGHQGAPGARIPVPGSCRYCGLLVEPGSGWDRSGHSAQTGSRSPRCDV